MVEPAVGRYRKPTPPALATAHSSSQNYLRYTHSLCAGLCGMREGSDGSVELRTVINENNA